MIDAVMQIEYVGRGSIEFIVAEVNRLGAENLLLVTGKNSYESCGAKEFLATLLADFQVTVFDKFSPNPTSVEVLAGAEVCASESCELIIAVGGGSCIDVAKAIKAVQGNLPRALGIMRGDIPLEKNLLPLIAVPTTAGTGSEATHFSVIYIEGKKYSLAAENLLPEIAILDAIFTDSLPAYITACTAFDALCQAIESYWAKGATMQSKGYAEKSIQLLWPRLLGVVNAPTNELRESVLLAANYAGKAINISKTTAPHALSYTITSLSGLPHGHAVALTLGNFFSIHANAECAPLHLVMQDLFEMLGVADAEEARLAWYSAMQACGLSTDVSELDSAAIIAGVNVERLGNHPIALDEEMLLSAFQSPC